MELRFVAKKIKRMKPSSRIRYFFTGEVGRWEDDAKLILQYREGDEWKDVPTALDKDWKEELEVEAERKAIGLGK